MIERLENLSPRAKALTALALFVLTPVAGYVGYLIGHFLATH